MNEEYQALDRASLRTTTNCSVIKDPCTYKYNWNSQHLPPRQMHHSYIKPLRSLHSQKFRQKPENPVQYKEQSESTSLFPRIHQRKITRARDTYVLQHRVDLHRMPQSFFTRYDDGPWEIRYRTVEFQIDEVSEPSECEPQSNRYREEIAKLPERDLLMEFPQHDEHRDRHPDHAPVRGHPSIPYGKDLQRVITEVLRSVEDNVPEPSPNDCSEDSCEEQGADIVLCEGISFLSREDREQPPRSKKCQKVHDAVPVDGDGANFKENLTGRKEMHGGSKKAKGKREKHSFDFCAFLFAFLLRHHFLATNSFSMRSAHTTNLSRVVPMG